MATLSDLRWFYKGDESGERVLRAKMNYTADPGAPRRPSYWTQLAVVSKRMNFDELTPFYYVKVNDMKCNVRFDDEQEAMRYAETVVSMQDI